VSSLLGRGLRLPLRLLPKDLVMTIRGGAARGMKWTVGSGNHACWLGSYEADKQRCLARFVRPGMTIYDVGAQAGFFTLIFARLAGAGRVYAFEPFAENVRHLLAHLRMNRVANVQVLQLALAEHAGLSGFTVDKSRYENLLTGERDATLLVPTLGLDEAVERHGLAPPDLMKIDAEGAESQILAGGRRTLERHRPIVFVALHGEPHKQSCSQLLASLGYRLFRLDGTPVVGSPDTDEVYALPDATR